MRIVSATGGIASTNCFLVADEKAKQAVLFDAPDHTVGPVLDEAVKQGWEIVGLWLTHGHFDHIADHDVVTKRFPKAKVLIHRLDEPKLITPLSRLFPLPFVIPPRKADGYVEEGQKLKIGEIEVDVIFTPGHSPGHVGFHLPAHQILIGGDLIIMGAVGRTDLPDSDPAALYESIRNVMRLEPETTLLPGHGEQSTLAEEIAGNPYVQEALQGR
jgi:glyoxylase-like metal-dependent hydrolase (beta-lactamase superfamily II)